MPADDSSCDLCSNLITILHKINILHVFQRVFLKGQHPGLSDEADAEVQKAAVHWVAT